MGVYKEMRNGRKNTTGKPNSASTSTMAFNELRFVNIDLSAEEKEEFRALLADGRFDATPFDAWLDAGYSFKLSRHRDGVSVVGTLTCSHREHVCAGGILSAFASDAATVIALLRYKDEVLSGELGWFEASSQRGKSGLDIG